MDITTKTEAMKRGNWDRNDYAPGVWCCGCSNHLCNVFLKILLGPAVVIGGLALKK